jgi:outer membrane receptor for ferrienterochelin and colicin
MNILFLLFFQFGTIQGYVTDSQTKERLVGVNVTIPNTQIGAMTNLDGFFKITGLEYNTYNIQISYVGYKTKIVPDIPVRTLKPVDLEIELIEDLFTSDAVTVEANLFLSTEKIAPSVQNLSKEEIRRFPGGFEDVVRTVSTLPGISINTEAGRNDLLVRGGGPSENLFIVNGMEVPNINHFGNQGGSSGSLSFINLDFVNNVEFSTGGFSSRYGDKMSSVFELDLQTGQSESINTKTLISATQFGLNIDGPIADQGHFLASVRKSYLDLIFKANGLPFVPVYTDANFLYENRFANNDKLTILSLYANDHTDKDNSTEDNRIFNSALLNNRQQQWINGISYRYLMDKGYIDFTANLNYNEFNFDQEDVNEDVYYTSNVYEREYVLKANYFTQLTKTFSMSNGMTYKFLNNQNVTTFADSIYNRSGNKVSKEDLGIFRNTFETSSDLSKYALFNELNWVGKSFRAQLGLRYDRYGYLNDADYFSPRLNLKYRINESLQLKGSTGLYYQSPSYVWLLNEGNKNLKALKNHMSILGAEYFPRTDWKVSIEFYNKNYTDLPVGVVPGVTDYIIMTNIGTGYGGRENDFQSFGYIDLVSKGTGEANGFELSVQKKYSDTPYYGQLSLSYGKSEYKALNGETYPGQFDQRWILNLAGGYIINPQWEVSGKYRFFTGSPYTPVYLPETNNGNLQKLPDEYLSERLDPVGVLDIRADYFIYFDRSTMTIFLDIQNALNTELPNRPRYDFVEQEIRKPRTVQILPTIGISYEF